MQEIVPHREPAACSPSRRARRSPTAPLRAGSGSMRSRAGPRTSPTRTPSRRGMARRAAWVVRRTRMRVIRFPRFGEEFTLATFCSGLGRMWAERRTSMTAVGETAGAVELVSLWVHLDPLSGRPTKLSADEIEMWGESTAGRTVNARLRHPGARRRDGRLHVGVSQHRARPGRSRQQCRVPGAARGGAAPGRRTASRSTSRSSTARRRSRARCACCAMGPAGGSSTRTARPMHR